jgi:hypothetical protein
VAEPKCKSIFCTLGKIPKVYEKFETFHSKTWQNIPNLDVWYENIPSGNSLTLIRGEFGNTCCIVTVVNFSYMH